MSCHVMSRHVIPIHYILRCLLSRNVTSFANMPCISINYEDKPASVHWSAARNKERSLSRGQNVYKSAASRTFCSLVDASNNSFIRSCKKTFRTVSLDALEFTRLQASVVFWTNRLVRVVLLFESTDTILKSTTIHLVNLATVINECPSRS